MRILLTASLLVFSTGCGLLIGNVKPVDEKSETYGVLDLSRENPVEWARLSAEAKGADAKDPEVTVAEIPDVAFQSKKTSSIISLNSACRASHEHEDKDLRQFTNLLFLGISDVTLREEQQVNFQKSPALETTIQGKLNGEPMMLRTVVLKKGECVYDLMYVARPDQFKANEQDFSHFVASLRLK